MLWVAVTVSGESKLTVTGTVKLPVLPVLPWIWIRSEATVVPGASGKLLAGFSDAVSSTSPGLAPMVSTAPV